MDTMFSWLTRRESAKWVGRGAMSTVFEHTPETVVMYTMEDTKLALMVHFGLVHSVSDLEVDVINRYHMREHTPKNHVLTVTLHRMVLTRLVPVGEAPDRVKRRYWQLIRVIENAWAEHDFMEWPWQIAKPRGKLQRAAYLVAEAATSIIWKPLEDFCMWNALWDPHTDMLYLHDIFHFEGDYQDLEEYYVVQEETVCEPIMAT